MGNLDKIREFNEKQIDPLYDSLLARIAASKWSGAIVVGWSLLVFFLGYNAGR